MSRLLICLAFLVFFGLLYTFLQPEDTSKKTTSDTAVATPRAEWFAMLSSLPEAGFPSAISWSGIFLAVTADPYKKEPLPAPDIITFVDNCLEKYDREVKGYKGILYKHEWVKGVGMRNPELIKFAFKENPHSVHMKWLKGAGLASEVIYVKGKNNNNILVKPPSLLSFFILQEPVDSPKAKKSGRVGIDEFGMALGLRKILRSWKRAKKKDNLHLEYEGLFRVKDASNRLCYKFHRTDYKYKEFDGVLTTDLTVYIDKKTGLQVGTIQRGIPPGGKKEQLIGEYYFRDIELNPEFPPNYFTRSTLTKR